MWWLQVSEAANLRESLAAARAAHTAKVPSPLPSTGGEAAVVLCVVVGAVMEDMEVGGL